MVLPIFRDFLNDNVLDAAVKIPLWRHFHGHDVGLIVAHSCQVKWLIVWSEQFEKVHTFIKLAEDEEDDGSMSKKHVIVGMFLWVVRCGMISEGDLREHLRFRIFFFQVVGLCHGHGLVDVKVEAFIRYGVCVFCGFLLDVCVMLCRIYCFWLL